LNNNYQCEKNFISNLSDHNSLKNEFDINQENKSENLLKTRNKTDINAYTIKERYENNQNDVKYMNYNRNYNTHSFHPYYAKN
jgi:hypothetical protein